MNFRTQKYMLHQRRTQSFLRWSGHFFSLIGILALGYVGFVLPYAKIYQA